MPRKPASASKADLHGALGGAAAVDRALTLLQCFKAGDAPLSLATLAERTGLYKSTVLRLLASLQHAMLVERVGSAGGGYVLGHGVARLHHVYSASYSLERTVMPVLQALVVATQESAAFHVLWGTGAQAQRLSLFRVDSPQPIRDHYKAGDMLPLAGGVGAKVLMAHSSDAALVAAHFQGDAGAALLAKIRADGHMAAAGDRTPEVAGIAAPVFKGLGIGNDSDRELAGALILTMPSHRFSAGYTSAVVQAAARLSASL